MKCFNHHDRDAFGTCKTCGKGLCLDCMKEVSGMIVCKDNPKCAETAKLVSISYDNIKNVYSKRTSIFTSLLGLAFLIAGIVLEFLGFGDAGMMILALIFCVMGITMLINNSKMKPIETGKK